MSGYISRVILLLPLFSFGAIQNDTINRINLDEIIVKSAKIISNKKTTPLSISSKNLSDDQVFAQQLSLQEYLNNIPGVFTTSANNFSQDLRLSIRGFGARSSFGIRGIKIIVDGIPQTSPDGQTQLDNLPIGIMESLEVIRGPAANLYGNSSGGVITINTISGDGQNKTNYKAIFGAYDYKSVMRLKTYNWDKTDLVVYYDTKESNGFRQFSGFKNKTINLKVSHRFSEKSNLVYQLNSANSPYAYDSGGLNIEEVNQDRRSARQRNIDYKTKETVKHLKTGLSWSLDINDRANIQSFAFYQHRDFYSLLPFEFGGIISLDKDVFGFGSRLENKKTQNNYVNTFQLGFDYSNQKDQRDRYRNNSGEEGENVFSQLEKFSSLGLYILNQAEFENGVLLRLGSRFDSNKIATDNMNESIILNKLNPSIGITYNTNNRSNLFITVGTSFETPTLNELSNNPTGGMGFNKDLEPISSLSYEYGWKGNFSNSSLEIIGYNILSSNEILPFELEEYPGKNFYRNVGETLRSGLELNWNYFLSSAAIQLSYTISDNKFKSYEINDSQLKGKKIPGIPNQLFDLSVLFKFQEELNLKMDYQLVGKRFADNLNLTEIESHSLLTLKISKPFYVKRIKLNSFIGVNNILNEKYFDNIRLNAFGKRYYEPAPNRNVYLGADISF
ncbi:MAG: TonB-dependent receptor family protein [Candidatus Marisimplicoccus sp.]